MNIMSAIFRVPVSLYLGGFLTFSTALLGQNAVSPQGGEIPILGSIPGDQVLPSLSFLGGVGYLAWEDNVIDKVGAGIGGATVSSEFAIGPRFRGNKTATGDQINPKVQVLANGNVIYVWQSRVAGTPDIYARWARGVVTKTSTSYGTNFYTADKRINVCVADQQIEPDVAALPDGSAVVTWSSYGQDGSMFGVYARRFKSTGVATTAKEFLVNQYKSYNQRSPAVAALANGNYVIAWISEQERYFNSFDVYARIFTAAGVPVTDEIAVNTTANPCATPAVAPLNDGGFTVVWSQNDASVPTNSWDVWGRPFTAEGTPEATDFRINTYLYGDQYRPKIASGPSGSLVVWTSMGQDGSREGVFGRFLQGGTQVSGNEFQVNTVAVSQQIHPTVAWNGVNEFLVVWSSFMGYSGFDLRGQAYALTTAP
jgi:hypothetical protein